MTLSFLTMRTRGREGGMEGTVGRRGRIIGRRVEGVGGGKGGGGRGFHCGGGGGGVHGNG